MTAGFIYVLTNECMVDPLFVKVGKSCTENMLKRHLGCHGYVWKESILHAFIRSFDISEDESKAKWLLRSRAKPGKTEVFSSDLDWVIERLREGFPNNPPVVLSSGCTWSHLPSILPELAKCNKSKIKKKRRAAASKNTRRENEERTELLLATIKRVAGYSSWINIGTDIGLPYKVANTTISRWKNGNCVPFNGNREKLCALLGIDSARWYDCTISNAKIVAEAKTAYGSLHKRG